jgi:hypothetical protein
MIGWLTALRDRPIAEQERQRAIIAVVLLLCTTALLLTLTGPDEQTRHATHNESQDVVVGNARAVGGAERSAHFTPIVERAVERFLAGYLGYLYGHVPAEKVQGTTVSFSDSLRAGALRVPPGMRARTARVVALRAASAPAGLVGVRVLINDGGLIDYPIVLLLEHRHNRWLVSGVDGAR